MKLPKFTFGMGDRFGHEGVAQLRAVVNASSMGIAIHPVWNKSNREHTIIGTEPISLRAEADEAVKTLAWELPYFVDADHINLGTVDRFVEASDFFTLDVADFVNADAAPEVSDTFSNAYGHLRGSLQIPGIAEAMEISDESFGATSRKFLRAIHEAGEIYRHILKKKGVGQFVVEVSVDETDSPQTPGELLLILAMIAHEGIPVQTIAPKFTGRFNKGVDYVGDLAKFEKEFDEDLYVLAYAVQEFGLPDTLKLSVHSGSDKFSLYPIIHRLVAKHDCGLHVKTAGTTWLEEVIGLAESGGEGLAIAKEIYAGSRKKFEELTQPYATVIDIDPEKLPTVEEVMAWDSERYAGALRHDATCPDYNPHFRQLIHVGFKVAAQMGDRYLDGLKTYRDAVERNVTDNLLQRHILPLFGK